MSNTDHTTLRVKELKGYLEKFLTHKLADPEHKKILLVRHGQSFGNLKEVIYGDLDYELTPKGKQQAAIVRDNLKDVISEITTFSVSEKLRSQQTGLIALGLDGRVSSTPLSHGYKEQIGKIQFKVDKRFNEFNLGRLEGIDCSKLTYAEQEALNTHFLEGKLIHESIESPDALFQRVSEGFSDLPSGEKANNLLIGHYGIVHVFLRKMDYCGVPISTGDSIFLEVLPDGTPYQLVAYWTK